MFERLAPQPGSYWQEAFQGYKTAIIAIKPRTYLNPNWYSFYKRIEFSIFNAANTRKMKLTINIAVLLAMSATLLTYSGCDRTKTPEPPVEEVQLGKLSKTWKVTSVKKDGVDLTTSYGSFKLILTGTVGSGAFTYTTEGRPTQSPWPSNGTWAFVDTDPTRQVIRDKGAANPVDITYAVTETTLQLNFDFQGTGYTARTGNVRGRWIMVFGL